MRNKFIAVIVALKYVEKMFNIENPVQKKVGRYFIKIFIQNIMLTCFCYYYYK